MRSDWLKEYLQAIDSKVKEICNVVRSIQDTQTNLIKDNQKNWDAYKNLTGAFDEHKANKCSSIDIHEQNKHMGLAGKILINIGIIIGAEASIIAAVWYLATHMKL